MSEFDPSAQQSRVAQYQETWRKWSPLQKGVAITGAGLAVATAVTVGITHANGEETPGEIPTTDETSDYYSPSDSTYDEDGYASETPEESESTQIGSATHFWESQGDYCRSEISTEQNKVTLTVFPSNQNLGATVVQHAGFDIKYDTTTIHGVHEHLSDGIDFDVYATSEETIEDAFDPDNAEYCGSFEIIDYDERGLPIFKDTAEATDDESSAAPSSEPTTEAPEPEEPFAFEGVEDGGDWYNCEINDETGDVRIHHNGGELPDGLALALFVYNSENTSYGVEAEIHFPNSQGRVTLEADSNYYSGHMAIIVPEDTPSGPNESYPPLDHVYLSSMIAQAGGEDYWEDAVSDIYAGLAPAELYPYTTFDENNRPPQYCN